MRIFMDPKYRLAEDFGILSGNLPTVSDEDKRWAFSVADKALTEAIPQLLATDYLRFSRDGNRSDYDDPYHVRRKNLNALLLGYVAGEKEKYTDAILNLVWAILEETSWVIPAHNVSAPYKQYGEPLPNVWDGDRIECDLFAAETGAILSMTALYMKDTFDAISPVIYKRIAAEVRHRTINPFTERNMRWSRNWMNNWTPWITSNVLTAAAVFAEDSYCLCAVMERAMTLLDRFADTYGADGGCSEGASYWREAVGCLFDASETLFELSGGEINAFTSPLLQKMCEFLPDMSVNPEEGVFVNFADCSYRIPTEPKFAVRMANRFDSPKLTAFAAATANNEREVGYYNIARQIRMLATPSVPYRKVRADATGVYADLQVATLRRGDFFLAVKGGHNAECHNHNDVGTVTLFYRGKPIFLDPGVGTYSKKTFSSERYTIWSMQSGYHNLPTFGGVMQHDGGEYRADAFSANGDGVFVSFASAYPKEAGVKTAEREATLTADGLTLTDRAVSQNPAVYSFMLRTDPEKIVGNTVYYEGLKIEFEGGTVTLECVDHGDDPVIPQLYKTDAIRRLLVKTSGKLTTRVTVL